MTEPKKAPAKRARAKAAPKTAPVPDKFAGFLTDPSGNRYDPHMADFQAAIAAGTPWNGPTK